jgi:hypothetical protein
MHCTLSFPKCILDPGKKPVSRIRPRGWSLWAAFAVTFLLPPVLCGQATGSISGNVTDKSASAIPGAAVTVTAQATGLINEN